MRMRAPSQQEPKGNRMPFTNVLVVLAAVTASVLGAKAGENRYTEITRAAARYWNDPKLKRSGPEWRRRATGRRGWSERGSASVR